MLMNRRQGSWTQLPSQTPPRLSALADKGAAHNQAGSILQKDPK